MPKRIDWKQGMRLTAEVLVASDNCTLELIGKALALAANGRFGLLPAEHPFHLELNISKNFVDVEELECLGLTKGGDLIDVHCDTRYSTSFNPRVPLPLSEGEEVDEYLLTINAVPGEWQEVNDGFQSPRYIFSLVSPKKPLSDHALPIARIVNEREYGWHIDDINFVPPCLYVSAHRNYMELLERFRQLLRSIDENVRRQLQSDGKYVMRIFWPVVCDLLITTDKERDAMTPMQLFGCVQKCVSAFTCACELDDYLRLGDAATFYSYVAAPYNYKDSYDKIQEGLELCLSIDKKVTDFQARADVPEKPAAPTVADVHLTKRCTNNKVNLPVTNNAPGAIVYYTTDGSEPGPTSPSGTNITVLTGFTNDRKREEDKVVVIKVKGVLNGTSSDTNTYRIVLKKDIERWTGVQI